MSQPSYDLFIDPRFAEIYRRQPIVLVDVGARGGLKSNWTAARRHLQMIGFEPDKREHARLADRGASGETIFDVALNNERGPVRLHVAKDRGLTSIYEPDRDFLATFPDPDRFETVAIESVDGDTLDSLRGAQQIRDIDFVKADTQGSELLVLQGARQSLVASAIGVEVEAEFTPIYKQQPVFADVDAYLRQRPAWPNHLDRRPVPQEPAGPARHHRRIRGGRSKRKSAEGRVDRPVVRLLRLRARDRASAGTGLQPR